MSGLSSMGDGDVEMFARCYIHHTETKLCHDRIATVQWNIHHTPGTLQNQGISFRQ